MDPELFHQSTRQEYRQEQDVLRVQVVTPEL